MNRPFVLLSLVAALCANASAQCLTAATGASVQPGLVKWRASDGYLSTLDVDDEGLTSPAIALTAFANFPMAGAVGNLDQMWVNTNGAIYLTDSTLGLLQPATPAQYGIEDLTEMRGAAAGASARIVAFGDDIERSAVAGAVWDIAVDQTVPGEVRVTWTDVARFVSATDRFSFDCTLYASGAVRYSYGASVPADTRYVGISIGNNVGSASSPSRVLTNNADSGAEGLLYQAFTAATWDLSSKQLMLLPNGLGGYFSTVTCAPAFHKAYGTGCYSYVGPATDSVHEFFPLPSLASAALQGNAMILVPTANGYTMSWVPGGAALYVAPSGGAVNVFATPQDDNNTAVTPSAPIPIPGGSTASINVMSNGVISAGATAAHGTDYSATSGEFATATIPAIYSWHDFNEAETSSSPVYASGRIKREEAGGVLYITWDNVESYADPNNVQNPSTQQFQVDMTTGVITVVWPMISPNDTETTFPSGLPYLVGLGGPGTTAAPSVTLATALPITTTPTVTLSPLTLSASPAPVYTVGGSSVPITYTVSNVIDVAPPLGIGITLLLASVAPFPGGLDLAFLDMPGCNLNILSLDVTFAMPGTAPTSALTLTIPQPLSPGLSFFLQAMSLFAPNSLPSGQNAFGAVLSNGLQSSFNTQ